MKTTHTGRHFHAVRFYANEASLCRMVAGFLGEGLAAGQPALVVGTGPHRRGIVEALRCHVDVAERRAARDLVMVDARKLMSTFMVDGRPEASRFMESTKRVLGRIAGGRRQGLTVRAYGEMVDLLWKDGFDTAAIQLEMLWNRLARTRDFSLLCGYSMGNFYKDACVASICAQHTHVVGADGTAVVSDAGSLIVGNIPRAGVSPS